MSHTRDGKSCNPTARAGYSLGLQRVRVVLGVVACAISAGLARAEDRTGTIEKRVAISGRVVDETGKAVADARVRLYRRESRWQRQDSVVGKSTSKADGSFELTTRIKVKQANQSPDFPKLVVIADHPGMAVGWATIPADGRSDQATIVLSSPKERTITVTDAEGAPVAGALVVAYGVGDPSSPVAHLANPLELRPDDGPLTALSGADGRTTFKQLPQTRVAVVARKLGFAEGYAFEGKDTIRLTPSASLSGTVKGPDGTLLAGVEVVLFADFMWHFERTVTDAQGKYKFDDLKANGWDMSAWRPKQIGNGKYRVWLDSDRFAIPTQTIVFEPNTPYVFDIQAQKAGVVNVKVIEEGTNKPVAGVRIWGFDAETGSGGRFNAYTDDHGRAAFYSLPTKINLSIAGPPAGVYLKGDVRQGRDSAMSLLFDGKEAEVTLVMAAIGGPLIEVSGTCTHPDGSPAMDVTVNANAGRFVTSTSMSYIRPRRTDAQGRFTLTDIPAGLPLCIYAEAKNRKLAGTTKADTPTETNRDFRLRVNLEATVTVDGVFKDDAGKPVGAKKFQVSPLVNAEDFPFVSRDASSDAEGRFKIDGIIPGLSYRVQEVMPPGPRVVAAPGGQLPAYQEVLILAPKDLK